MFLPLALAPLISIQAYSEVYMTEDKALAAIFPGLKFDKAARALSKDDKEKIEKASGETVRADDFKGYKAATGEWVVIDQVLGKHEFITYAVGLEKDGKVKAIEILEYRETYGGQVRGDPWRQQFVGKDKTAPLKIDQDIKNISGASLSSKHVTGGVRRVLQTYEVVKNRS